jgi:uncharacterized protein (TIGR03083 family)
VPAARLTPDELHHRCIDAVVTEGERIGVVVQELAAGRTPVDGGLSVEVPWVPAWTVRDLVVHLGGVHRWATGILRAGNTRPPGPAAPARPPHDDLPGWYALGLTELVATLRTVDPGTPTWHMSPAASGTARDWSRRQAHEHVVHRLDVEVAAGVRHAAVDAVLAGDGVAELLGVILPRWASTPPLVAARAAVTVTAPDVGRSWLVEVEAGQVQLTEHEPGPAPDLTGVPGRALLSGDAEQLLRRVWGRPAEVAVHGDPAAEALLRGR